MVLGEISFTMFSFCDMIESDINIFLVRMKIHLTGHFIKKRKMKNERIIW
jgi:hypothetical protein